MELLAADACGDLSYAVAIERYRAPEALFPDADILAADEALQGRLGDRLGVVLRLPAALQTGGE